MNNECEYCGNELPVTDLYWTENMDLACFTCYDLWVGVTNYYRIFRVLYELEKIVPHEDLSGFPRS